MDLQRQGVLHIAIVDPGKTPPDFQEQGVVHIALVYPTKTPADFQEQSVVHITRVYHTKMPQVTFGCPLGALPWVSGDLRVPCWCSAAGFG